MISYFTSLRAKHQAMFAIVISIAVVSFWRGMWGLMDYYLFPTNPVSSYIASIAIGVVILIGTGITVEALT